jgi:hypothetical protein
VGTYVETIEPRLTPLRDVCPITTAETLIEWCRDLVQELAARLELVTPEDLSWRPHRDSNYITVTVRHIARCHRHPLVHRPTRERGPVAHPGLA